MEVFSQTAVMGNPHERNAKNENLNNLVTKSTEKP
jgi:hypothetical protein